MQHGWQKYNMVRAILMCPEITTGRIKEFETVDAEVGMIIMLSRILCRRLTILQEHVVLSISAYHHSYLPPATPGCSTFIFAPVFSDVHQLSAISPFSFRKQSSHNTMLRHSLAALIDLLSTSAKPTFCQSRGVLNGNRQLDSANAWTRNWDQH